MLTRIQVGEAVEYNAGKVGSLRGVVELSWPWSGVDPQAFVWVTALFQLQNDLKVDGKLGRKTLAVVRASKDMVKESIDSKPAVGQLGDSVCSNAVIVNGERVLLPTGLLDAGLTASNYVDDDEPRLKHRKRSAQLVHFVLHETCGNTASGCKRTLLKKGYGVQLILDPKGHLSCHGDLVLDRMVHANQLNNTSFGIEIVNPYNPIYVNDKKIWSRTIPRAWWTWVPSVKSPGVGRLLKRRGWKKVPKEYVTPTVNQMTAIELLVPWLCEVTGVPCRFPTKGLNRKKRKIAGLTLRPRGRPGPGVVAHRDHSSHSDGRYVLESVMKSLSERFSIEGMS